MFYRTFRDIFLRKVLFCLFRVTVSKETMLITFQVCCELWLWRICCFL